MLRQESFLFSSGYSIQVFPFCDETTRCGGTLISPTRVLTAAHCISSFAPRQVRVGASTTSDGTLVDVACAKRHPDFAGNSTSFVNDIAILKLAEPVDVSEIAINANSTYPEPAGRILTALGLGFTVRDDRDSLASTLQKISIYNRNPLDCAFLYPFYEDDQQICTFTDSIEGSGCSGDSGGPLIDIESNTQVGIASRGTCGRGLTIWTRVSKYNDWIQDQLTDTSCDGCGKKANALWTGLNFLGL